MCEGSEKLEETKEDVRKINREFEEMVRYELEGFMRGHLLGEMGSRVLVESEERRIKFLRSRDGVSKFLRSF